MKDAPKAPLPGSLRLQVPRTDIALASLEVFARHGVAATRVEDLLLAAKVARRTFYRYFRSKEDVLSAAYELVTRELLESMRAGSESAPDPLSGVRATLDVYLGFHVDNHRVLRAVVEPALQSDSPLAPLRRRFRAALCAQLDAAVTTATKRSLDPWVFLGLISALEGLSLELLAQPSAPTEADVARARAVMHGLLDVVTHGAARLPERA